METTVFGVVSLSTILKEPFTGTLLHDLMIFTLHKQSYQWHTQPGGRQL